MKLISLLILAAVTSLPALYSPDSVQQYPAKSIGLALSGGGARALAHIGVLKVLEDYNIEVDYISGTSLGALIGAFYAIGWSPEDLESLFIDFDWSKLTDDTIARNDYFIGEKRWKEYYNISFDLGDDFKPKLPKGFVYGNRITNLLFDKFYRFSHNLDFKDLPISFSCISTDLLTGEMIVHQSGHLHEAVRASLTVPSIMSPFLIDDRLLIDGGVKMNLPSPLVSEMGAEIVIGVKVTSDLRSIEQLTSPIAVFDQTLNISSLEQKNQAALQTDILVLPELKNISSTDFGKAKEIIRLGEEAARSSLATFFGSDSTANATGPEKEGNNLHLLEETALPDTIYFSSINVVGNNYLTDAKIREYSKLRDDHPLTKSDILKGVESAHRSGLFDTIYPVIEADNNNQHILTLKVQEKNRKRFGFNIRYNEHDDITFGTILEMRNYLGRNSKLLASLDLGGRPEFLIDYVKNYGREWGAYFRLFPYINEHTTYNYDDERNKTSSSKSFETGATFGLGGFIGNRLIVEPYIFTFYKKLYRDISHIDFDEDTFCSGFGIKSYYETLDDTVFPMSGRHIFLKLSHSSESPVSELSFNKFHGKVNQLMPIYKRDTPVSGSPFKALSLEIGFEYGSYFGRDMLYFDPFYVGGIDSFLGLRKNQMMIDPVVKIASLTTRAQLRENIFLDLTVNAANLSDLDYWHIDADTVFGGGMVLGFRNMFAPLRLGIGIDDGNNAAGYISIGYDSDPFFFSRK